LFSLLALLLVSTAILADGRPTGIRIGRAVSGGGTNVQIDVTVTDTFYGYSGGASNFYYSTVWLGNQLGGWTDAWGQQYASPWTSINGADPLPWAIDWGDGYYVGDAPLFGPPGGPWQGTFAHTYVTPGSYTVTAGDALGAAALTNTPTYSPWIYSGNAVTGHTRYGFSVYNGFTNTWTYESANVYLAITANATVNTGTGIPTLNIYGLLAMAFVLVGAGLLVYRKPQQA
jgi:hypothetical protein